MAAEQRSRRRIRWRYWNKIVHRDVGYACAALTIVYAVSGIAVNHIHQWNPNYAIERTERSFEPIPVTDRETMTKQLVERLDLPGPPDESFRPDPGHVHLFYDGWSVEADTTAGTAIVEHPRDRPLLRDMNFLHLNHAKGVWTLVADLYAALLLLLAISGLFMLKGRSGLGGRGKWFVGLGLLVPVGFVIVLRYLG